MDSSFKPPCPHPHDKCAPVMGKVATYKCAECGVEFTRTKPTQVDPPKPKVVDLNAEERAMHTMLVNLLVQAMAPWRNHMMGQGAQPNSDFMLASAAATFAGTIIGELSAMGMTQPGAVDACLAAYAENMASGVIAGQAKVARVAQQQLAEEGGKPS